MESSDKRIVALLAVAALALFSFTTRGYLSLDEEMMFLVTEGVCERGDPAVGDTILSWANVVTGADGRRYSFYDSGQSLLAIPFYAAGKMAAAFLAADKLPFVTRFFVCHLGALFGAAAVAYAFLLARQLRLRWELALGAAVMLAVATPLWFYSRTFYREAVLAFCLCAGAYHLFRHRERGYGGDLLLAGGALGLAILVKQTMLLVAVPAAVYIIGAARADKWTPAAVLRRSLVFAVPVAAAIALTCFYNYYRFESIAPRPQIEPAFATPLFVGTYGLLLSPGRGLLVFCPLLVVLVFSLRTLAGQRHRHAELVYMALAFACQTALHAKWTEWHAGLCWGPRFLVCALPFLVVATACAVENVLLPQLRWRARNVGFACLVAASIHVQITGVALEGRFLDVGHFEPAGFPDRLWNAYHSPVLNLEGSLSLGNLSLERTQLPFGVKEIQDESYQQVRATSPSFWWAYLYRAGFPTHYLLPAFMEALVLAGAGLGIYRIARGRGAPAIAPARDVGRKTEAVPMPAAELAPGAHTPERVGRGKKKKATQRTQN